MTAHDQHASLLLFTNQSMLLCSAIMILYAVDMHPYELFYPIETIAQSGSSSSFCTDVVEEGNLLIAPDVAATVKQIPCEGEARVSSFSKKGPGAFLC